jgi:hypothetical protein
MNRPSRLIAGALAAAAVKEMFPPLAAVFVVGPGQLQFLSARRPAQAGAIPSLGETKLRTTDTTRERIKAMDVIIG